MSDARWLGDWKIDAIRVIPNRWSWSIRYPISKYAIVPDRTFASKSAAMRDARRVIRIIHSKANAAGEAHE